MTRLEILSPNVLMILSSNDKERIRYEDRKAALLDKISALEKNYYNKKA